MDKLQFEHLWKRLESVDKQSLNHPSMPLAGMDEVAAWFNLPTLNLQPPTPSSQSTPPLPQPAFKNLTDDILLALRLNLQSEETSQWAEKMMRYCEIFYSTLRQKALDKCGNLPQARLLLLHLTVFFLQYYRYTKDLRFLNIALKMGDLGWLVSPALVENRLGKSGTEGLAALFGTNLLMSLEQAMGELESAEIPHA